MDEIKKIQQRSRCNDNICVIVLIALNFISGEIILAGTANIVVIALTYSI